MKYFIYKVKDESGRTLSGVQQAENKNDVKRKVSKGKYYFISAVSISKEKLFSKSVTFETLIMFTHRLTTLIEAGIPILQAMTILWRQTEEETIQVVISYMRSELEEGNRISSALSKFPKIFPVVYTALIKVGEASGALPQVLRKLSDFLEYKAAIISRTKRAMLYPTIVLSFSVVVVIAMFFWVVPIFQKLLLRLDVDLPWPTVLILNISNFIRSWYFLLFIVVVIISSVIIRHQVRNSQSFGLLVHRLSIRIPYFGRILLTLSLSQFVRSLSILLAAGVPVVESLAVANSTTGNKKLMKDLDFVRSQAEEGVSLYDSFKQIKDLPVMMVEMIGVGETTGMMVQVLDRVTNQFDEEVDYNINKFLTILEPLLIIMVGGIVGLVLAAIYLPVTTIWQGLMS